MPSFSKEIQFYERICRDIKNGCRHMWQMATRLDNTALLHTNQNTWLLFEIELQYSDKWVSINGITFLGGQGFCDTNTIIL